jgi:hypothetical protein
MRIRSNLQQSLFEDWVETQTIEAFFKRLISSQLIESGLFEIVYFLFQI